MFPKTSIPSTRLRRLTDEILRTRRESLRRSQIVEEVLDVAREARDRAASDKAKDFHAAVVAHVQAPGSAGKSDRCSVAANGIDTAVAAEPDHKLVIATGSRVVDICCSEKIVRDVGSDVSVADSPDGGSWDRGDLRDKLLREITRRVGVALDVVVAACPLPGRGPRDTRAGDRVEG